VALLLSGGADAAPSFDCAKAQSTSEKAVCQSADLQWFDRQLARLYKLARDPITPNGKTLLADQRDFLARRDGCGDSVGCLWRAYETRLVEVARWVDLYEPYARYEQRLDGLSGYRWIWIVRFGFDAALKIQTGGAGPTCAFETDSATVGGKGVVRVRNGACRIDIVPNDGDGTLVVEAKNCQDYCGMRASMNGVYVKAR